MRSLIYYILPLILCHCAPQKPNPKNDNHDGSAPVLILNNEHVSLNEFERRIEALPEFAQSKLSSIETKRAHLTGVAKFEILARYAAKIGFAKDPEVVSALKIALQKSNHQTRIELTPTEIENEIKRTQRQVRYGMIVEDADCSLEGRLSLVDASKRIEAIQARATSGVKSFSTRLKEPELDKEQATLLTLAEVGDLKVIRGEDRCTVVVLTKIEEASADKLKIETDLRAKKIRAFEKTLEK